MTKEEKEEMIALKISAIICIIILFIISLISLCIFYYINHFKN